MESSSKSLYPSSVQRKTLIGFSLTFVAILLALGIAHFAFRDVMDTVDDLTAPNEKLTLLNHVFQEITTLDQQQRAEAISSPHKPYRAFLNESKTLLELIDSLQQFPWDSVQQKRIAAIKDVFKKRDKAFFSYLKQKSELVANTQLSKRIDTLSSIIQQKKIEVDTSVVTTQKKTTTTYLPDTVEHRKKDDRFFLSRIFSKKKSPPPTETARVKVEEELSVSVDTLAISKQNKALEEVEKIVTDLETDQRSQNQKLLRQELELIHANTLFSNELLSILHDVENEELQKMHARNDHAATLMNQSIGRIILLLLVFFLGAALLVYLIWIDISKSNYYKEQLERARDEAEQLSQIKQRFLSNMSHEIRTPLQSIIGFTEQIQQHAMVDHDAVQAIQSSSEHLLHIVNEVLDYSRISSGNFTFEKETFNLTAIIREVESAIRIQAEKKRLTFLLEAEACHDQLLQGDSFRLRQILYNLLGNAVKFTHTGYIKLTVRTIPNLNSVRCIFEISDTGIGIAREDLDKIFNQFEQANASIARQFGGTGLGLTIVKSLIEAQDGELDVSSEPGKGSVFTVELVYAKASHHNLKQEQPKSALSKTFAGKVVVVDDDAMILRLCGLVLKKHQIPHQLYAESEKVLTESFDSSITHFFMDIRMPHINGIELCRALKNVYGDRVTYVALTAHVLPEEQQELLQLGFTKVLTKPFRESELIALLGLDTTAIIPSPEKETLLKPIVDLSLLRQMTFGDEQLFQSVVTQFVVDTERDLQKLSEGIALQKALDLREIVHKLAGRIGQMGNRELSSKLHDIEAALIEDDSLQTLLPHLQDVKEEVVQMVSGVRESSLQHS